MSAEITPTQDTLTTQPADPTLLNLIPLIKTGVFATILLLMAAFIICKFKYETRLETDILSLLPHERSQTVLENTSSAAQQLWQNKILVLLKDSREVALLSAAQVFDQCIAKESTRSPIQALSQSVTGLSGLSAHHPYQLYGSNIDQLLSQPNIADSLWSRLQLLLQMPLSERYTRHLPSDPLLLHLSYLSDLPSSFSRFTQNQGVLMYSRDSQRYALLPYEIQGSSFDRITQQAVIASLSHCNTVVQQALSSISIFTSGALIYATTIASTTESEAGQMSLAALFLLVFISLWAFSGLWPLAGATTTILGGLLTGTSAVLYFFDSPHAITFGFGATIVGIAADYAFHAYSHASGFENPCSGPASRNNSWYPDLSCSLSEITPALTLAALSSILSYCCLFLLPVPGLRQLAVFAAFGILGAYLSAICILPSFPAPRRQSLSRQKKLTLALVRYVRLWQSFPLRTVQTFVVSLAILVALLLTILWHTDDNLTALKSIPPNLREVEQVFKSVVGINTENSGAIYVEADSPNQLLERSEALNHLLEKLVSTGKLIEYRSVSQFVSSCRVQRERYLNFARAIAPEKADLEHYLSELGLAEGHIELPSPEFADHLTCLTDEEILSSLPASLRPMSFEINARRRYFGLIQLNSNVDSNDLRTLLEPELLRTKSAFYVSLPYEYGKLLKAYRKIFSLALLVSACVAFVLLSLSYGIGNKGWSKFALAATLAPVIAALSGIGALLLLGYALNLFAVLATLIVLGLGVDSSFFLFAHHKRHGNSGLEAPLLAIFLSSLTTASSFALLSLSSQPVLQILGIVVSVGVIVDLLLSPVVLVKGGEMMRE